MTATLHGAGPVSKSLERDSEGHRNYSVSHLVRTTSIYDGPQVVMTCPGLPAIGSIWSFGNDLDVWAFCYPDLKVEVWKTENESTKLWLTTQKFSTKPLSRCQDETIEDPLLEPQKVSGSFVNLVKEIKKDRNGNAIKSSSHELIRGALMEFDHGYPTVHIEQNVGTLGLNIFSGMVNKLNDDTLWGCPTRCVKLSNVSWERKLYGLCEFYYTRAFDFNINLETFDRTTWDEGTKALGRIAKGSDPPTWEVPTGWVKTNPLHFTRYKDKYGDACKVLLDGNGQPLTDGANPIEIDIEYYDETNFLVLGIPTVF